MSQKSNDYCSQSCVDKPDLSSMSYVERLRSSYRSISLRLPRVTSISFDDTKTVTSAEQAFSSNLLLASVHVISGINTIKLVFWVFLLPPRNINSFCSHSFEINYPEEGLDVENVTLFLFFILSTF